MVTLNLFIESHYKYIVLSIRERHILTLHLSTANCRILTTTGCCCKNAAATQCSRYAIYFCLVESIPQFLELWPMPMHVWVRSSFTLLYRNATSYGITKVARVDTFDSSNKTYNSGSVFIPENNWSLWSLNINTLLNIRRGESTCTYWFHKWHLRSQENTYICTGSLDHCTMPRSDTDSSRTRWHLEQCNVFKYL